ncbi:MAG: tail fiber protein [Bacilli bacterium]|nr:tail fiber protein [Bacilli bacterium]
MKIKKLNKYGFTLIELLAVIVILGVIMVIAIPFITGYIERSKKDAFDVSAYNILDAGSKFYVSEMDYIDGIASGKISFEIINKELVGIDGNTKKIDFKGTLPDFGKMQINSSGDIELSLCDKTFCACKAFTDNKIIMQEDNCFVNSETGNVETTTEPTTNTSSTITGTIISFLSTSTPEGYVKCDGTIYNIVDYPKLANFIKNQYGSFSFFGGDGTNTFAVPNINDRYLKGSSNPGQYENAGLPEISGTLSPSSDVGFRSNASSYGGSFYATTTKRNFVSSGVSEQTSVVGFKASLSSPIYGSSSTVTPNNFSVVFYIKY